MKYEEWSDIIKTHARKIAEAICATPRGWHKEVYWNGERISFSESITLNTYTLDREKIGRIRGLEDIPCEWGVEYCNKCDEYHPVSFKDGEMEYNHSVNAWDQLVDILEDEIMLEPEAWVKPTLLLE